jgi:hypothetical protein
VSRRQDNQETSFLDPAAFVKIHEYGDPTANLEVGRNRAYFGTSLAENRKIPGEYKCFGGPQRAL